MKNLFLKANIAIVCSAFFSVIAFAQNEQFLVKDPKATAPPMSNTKDNPEVTNTNKGEWSEASLKAVEELKGKYGAADETTDSRMIWFNKGPFKEIIVYAEAIQHDFPMPHKDVMESVLNYQVPPNKFDDIAMFDGSISIDRTRGTMSAMCDKEANNFLALNVAHDIIKNVRTPMQARAFFAKTVMAAKDGNMSPYMKKIGFDKMSNTMDSDVKHKMGATQVKMRKENGIKRVKDEKKGE